MAKYGNRALLIGEHNGGPHSAHLLISCRLIDVFWGQMWHLILWIILLYFVSRVKGLPHLSRTWKVFHTCHLRERFATVVTDVKGLSQLLVMWKGCERFITLVSYMKGLSHLLIMWKVYHICQSLERFVTLVNCIKGLPHLSVMWKVRHILSVNYKNFYTCQLCERFVTLYQILSVLWKVCHTFR